MVFVELIVLFVLLIAFYKWQFTYWKRKGVPCLTPKFPLGDVTHLFSKKISFGEQFLEFYQEFKGKRHGGIFLGFKPVYFPTDLEIIKGILQKDFSHFINRGQYFDEVNDPLSGHLLHLHDAKWKNMRTKLTPTFSSGKMKMMFETLANCALGLRDIVDEAVGSQTPIDVKDVSGRFTTDTIGSVVFGLQCNSLNDPETDFLKFGKKAIHLTSWERLMRVLQVVFPLKLLRLLRIRRTKVDVAAFFTKVIKDTVEYREKNNVFRKDFMHLLLQLKNRGEVSEDGNVKGDKKALTFNELSAQAYAFFTAGFETSSTTMTFTLFELAVNPLVQEELRKEIKRVFQKYGELTYEAVSEMTYLEKVIQEALRKYPPAPLIIRACNKDYQIPGTEIILEKDTSVIISLLGIQNDPKYYPDPEKFDPERFSEENKRSRHGMSWLPFGEGPRICIGMRFGMMQSKVGLATLLKDCRISLNERTRVPLKFDKGLFLGVKGGVWIDVERVH